MTIKDIKSPEDILEFMKENIKYGWLDINNEKHIGNMKNFRKLYRTMTIEETLEHKIGTCIEQANLMSTLLTKLNIPNKMYCTRIYEGTEFNDLEAEEHMHCFVLYYLNNKVYQIEHPNWMKIGIYFIEYIPAENAWVPIEAEGYLYINCLWIAGAMKGHGYSNDLLNECVRDAVAQGRNGVCILCAEGRKREFLADPKFLTYKGFRTADVSGRDVKLFAGFGYRATRAAAVSAPTGAVAWAVLGGAAAVLFAYGSLFFGESEKRPRRQGQALPPRVLMGIAYFWQVLRKR